MQDSPMKKMSEVEQEALSKIDSLTEQLFRLRPLPQTDDTLERTRLFESAQKDHRRTELEQHLIKTKGGASSESSQSR